jgi:hypothetical protein
MTEEQNYMAAEGRESRRARKRAEGLWWAGALIWAGLVFGAESLELLAQVGSADAWSWVFLGAGLYGLVSDLYYVRAASHADRALVVPTLMPQSEKCAARSDPTAWCGRVAFCRALTASYSQSIGGVNRIR